ncbi:hypothetical protein KSP40_PGU013362 [Platanthera guangdongensis]|uniref:Uncharacterized protein n=1 Tax=Platanthera guangdongensis TaxID=2320717 RepID=A0ABR2N584_9ASPA
MTRTTLTTHQYLSKRDRHNNCSARLFPRRRQISMASSSPPPPRPQSSPPISNKKSLLKQRSWSPETDYEDSWQRRKSLSKDRRHRRALSVTDEDIDELRGFLDLGLVSPDGYPHDGGDCAKRMSDALPALDLYLAVRRSYRGSSAGGGSPTLDSTSSSNVSPAESPLSVFAISSSESPEVRLAGIKRWARLVALATRGSS